MKQKKPTSSPAPLLFTMSEVMELLKYKSRQAVYDLLRRDDSFPRPRRTPTGYLVWLSAEVIAWVIALPVAEFSGADAIEAHALRGLEAAQ